MVVEMVLATGAGDRVKTHAEAALTLSPFCL